MTEKNNESKKKNKKIVVIMVILLLLVAGLLGYIFVYLPWQESQKVVEAEEQLQAEMQAELGIMPGMDEEDIEQRLNEKVAEGMLNISANPDPVFENGASEGNVRIENIPGNNYSVTVEMVLDEGNEVVYKSGLIEPGYFLETAKLDSDLDAGDYPGMALFTAYDQETNEKIGTAGIRVNIHVLS